MDNSYHTKGAPPPTPWRVNADIDDVTPWVGKGGYISWGLSRVGRSCCTVCHMPLSAPLRVPICTASLATDRNLRPALPLHLSPRVRVRGAWLPCAALRRTPPTEFSSSSVREIGRRRHPANQTKAFAPYARSCFPGLLETPIKCCGRQNTHVSQNEFTSRRDRLGDGGAEASIHSFVLSPTSL